MLMLNCEEEKREKNKKLNPWGDRTMLMLNKCDFGAKLFLRQGETVQC